MSQSSQTSSATPVRLQCEALFHHGYNYQGHNGQERSTIGVLSVAVSADGTTMFSGGTCGSWRMVRAGKFGIQVVDRDDSDELEKNITSVAIGGEVKALGRDSGSARVWRSHYEDAIVLKTDWMFSSVLSCALSYDGSMCVVMFRSGGGKSKILYRGAGRDLWIKRDVKTMSPWSLALSGDGRRMYLSGRRIEDRNIFDVVTLVAVGNEPWKAEKEWKDLDLSSNSTLGSKVCTNADGTRCGIINSRRLVVWKEGLCNIRMSGYARKAPYGATRFSCAMSGDGRILVASMGRNFGVWNADTGVLLAQLEGHSRDGTSCGLSADGRTIATGSFDGTMRVWVLPDHFVSSKEDVVIKEGKSEEVSAVTAENDEDMWENKSLIDDASVVTEESAHPLMPPLKA